MNVEKELGPITRAELVAAASAYVTQGKSDDQAIDLGLALIENINDRLSSTPLDAARRDFEQCKDEITKNPLGESERIVQQVFGILGIKPRNRDSFQRESLSSLYKRIIDSEGDNAVRTGTKIRKKLIKEFEENRKRARRRFQFTHSEQDAEAQEEADARTTYLNLATDHDASSHLETYEVWVAHACHVIQKHYKIRYFSEIDEKVIARLNNAKIELEKRRDEKVSVEKEKAETERNSEAGGIPEH